MKQTGTPGADNQRTVIVPEASPARSHSRCWRWQSGLGAQWQTSAHVKTQLQHTAPDVVSASCAVQRHASANLPWPPCRVLREDFLYLKTSSRNVLRHKKLSALRNDSVWCGFSNKSSITLLKIYFLLSDLCKFRTGPPLASKLVTSQQPCSDMHVLNSDLRWTQRNPLPPYDCENTFVVSHTSFCKGRTSKWSDNMKKTFFYKIKASNTFMQTFRNGQKNS